MGFFDELGDIAGTLVGGTAGFLVGGPAGAIAGAQLGGGIDASRAAGSAANQAAAGQRNAIQAQREMFDLIRADTEYQRQAGRSATDALLSMVGLPGLSAPNSVPLSVSSQPQTVNIPAARMPWTDRRGNMRRGSSYGPVSNVIDGLVPGHEPRVQGGPIQEGGRYMLSEFGQPEAIVGRNGQLAGVTTSPTSMTSNINGTVVPLGAPIVAGGTPGFNFGGQTLPPAVPPLSQTGAPQVGNPIPGSSVLENPGGQPGRYNFMADPGYGFRFDEGQRAIERSAAARGMGLSGSVLKELTRYGQGIASQEYGNVYGRLAGIANLGQGASNLYGQAAQNTGQGLAGAYGNIGNIQGAGTLGRNSAYQNILANLAYQYGTGGSGGGRTPGIAPGPTSNGGWGDIDWSGQLPYGDWP